MINQQSNDSSFPIIIDLFVFIYLIGLVSSKALLSIGMIGLSCVCFAYAAKHFKIDKSLRIFLFPTIIFLATILSGINSDNSLVWTEYLIKKLPFLILPFAFYFIRDHISRRYYHYLAGFVVILCICSIYILLKYVADYEAMQKAISQGKAMMTPIDHSEFSLFVAFGTLVGIILFADWPKVLREKYKMSIGIMSIFLALFIHILAVRSGIVILYSGLFLIGSYHFIKKKKYKSFILLLTALIIIPIIGIKTIPSLKAKMDYVKYDLSKFQKGEGLNYSDSERLYSLNAGWTIFKQNKIFGVGIGDLKDACKEQYGLQHNFTINHYPHNQYIFVLAGLGLIGFLLYTISLLGPLWSLRHQLDNYIIALHIIILVSALVENTTERTFSIGFYLFFTLASISYLNNKWKLATS